MDLWFRLIDWILGKSETESENIIIFLSVAWIIDLKNDILEGDFIKIYDRLKNLKGQELTHDKIFDITKRADRIMERH